MTPRGAVLNTLQPLYTRVLGQTDGLDPVVAALFADSRCARARGSMRVRRGRTVRARVLSLLLRLPRDATAMPIVLEIARHQDAERWSRRFGAHRTMSSTQWLGRDGGLCERYGPVELFLDAAAVDGALVLTGHRAVLRLGPLQVPVPWRWAPVVEARASRGERGSVVVRVQISLRRAGLVLAYAGEVTRDDD